MPNDFFQFPHPGGEPPVNFLRNGICPANNTGTHFRKFLYTDKGCYVIPNNSPNIKNWDYLDNARLTFWGEWEHSSSVTFPSNFHQHSRPNNYKGLPFQLHTPRPFPLTPTHNLQNNVNSCSRQTTLCGNAYVMSTDPFVFCEPILYYHCKIHTFKKLGNLKAGDIVVFGSKLSRNFVVDTVFVTNDWVSVQAPSICRLFSQANGAHFPKDQRVCRGATFATPIDGMFSFFPALPCTANGEPQPFRRPTLNLSGLVNHNHGRGLRIKSIPNSKEIWNQIVDELISQKLVLGLRA